MTTTVTENYDVVVCGGGLAGFTAAVAAARQGASTCLVQNRPVLGGCSSSEVRVIARGAASYHGYAREGGILREMEMQERHHNHQEIFESGWANSVWDMTMYDMVQRTEGLALKLNTTVLEALTDGHKPVTVKAVRCHTPSEEKFTVLFAKQFIDCTGDGIVAMSAGCSWRRGEEARAEFNEPHAPAEASNWTMGNSLLFKTVDTGHEVPFIPPEWAIRFDNPDYFDKQGRFLYDTRGGFWWIELGKPWDVITDGETIRHELTRRVYGVWDWMKNRDPRFKDLTRNLALDWIGQVPGMRESRRIEGLHMLTEDDVRDNVPFPDEVAYGGWNIDLHTVGGMLADSSEPTAATGYDTSGKVSAAVYVGPFGVPLRSLIARDATNLLLGGRIVSATHVSLGSVRVMGTTAIMGQAAGTTAAMALQKNIPLHETPDRLADEIQQRLLRDGCFLPHVTNHDPDDHALRADSITASSEDLCSGADVDSIWVDGGLVRPTDALQNDVLTVARGQWIPVSRGVEAQGIDTLSVLLRNDADAPVPIRMALVGVASIWDYRRDTGCILASHEASLEPGEHRVIWPVKLDGTTLDDAMRQAGLGNSGYVRFDIEESPSVTWPRAGRIVPGALSAFEMQPGKLRRFHDGVTMNWHIEPAQRVYHAEQVTSGEFRPHLATNLWRSDPQEDMPAWLELAWNEPRTVQEIVLEFEGNALYEFDRCPTFWSDPQTARDYEISVADGNGDWKKVVEVTDNFMSRRVHHLDYSVTANRVRLTVTATNGDPSVGVYEIRCY